MKCLQKHIRLEPKPRGCHLITREVERQFPELAEVASGVLHVFLQHTSASLTINENADPDVRSDFEMAMNRIVPEDFPYQHTAEGPDDMPAHLKGSLLGVSAQVPVNRGRMDLGTWQGLYLCEHRDAAGGRRLVLTLFGN